ncbi:MAG: hypothetical protein L6Q97_04425 [Thermoanaerobaculia bacterium]|nr:hypothetical protein [Thermoanaerobaculia bacterium]
MLSVIITCFRVALPFTGVCRLFLFDVANLKQLVFKNKKCQRFFLQLFNFFLHNFSFTLQINALLLRFFYIFPKRQALPGGSTRGGALFRLIIYRTFVAGKKRIEGLCIAETP